MNYNKKDLINTVEIAFKKASILKTEVLFSYTFKIETDFNSIKSNILNENEMFYISLPRNENQFIGKGNLINSDTNKNIDISKCTVISNLKNNEDTLFTFNISAFDQGRKTGYPWVGIPRNKFIIPKVLLQKNGKITLNKIINLKQNQKAFINDFKEEIKILCSKHKTKYKQIKLSDRKTIPSKNEYLNIIGNTVAVMNNSELKKIVLSKVEKNKINSQLNTSEIIRTMEENYTKCFNFFIKLNKDDAFFGSSPEILLKKEGVKLSSAALAGTSDKKDDLNTIKEIEEHQYVLDHIKSTFIKYCPSIKISKTVKLKMNYAYHLYSEIKGRMKTDSPILEIINNLYPTPALSGYPKEEAIKKIRTTEIFDRGYYGGLIGFYNQNDNGSFFVPIRSALKRKNEIYFFAGGGITEKSESLKEWKETEIKLKHIKSIIVPE